MTAHWIVYKNSAHPRMPHWKRKYLVRPIADGGRWHWTYTGIAARFYDDGEAYSYAVKYKGSIEEVS